MPIVSELVVSIVGGVATALILGALVRPAAGDRNRNSGETRRGGSLLGDLIHMLLAVGGGIATTLLVGKLAIQSGILAKGLGGRLTLLVGGTTLCWLLMLPLRRR